MTFMIGPILITWIFPITLEQLQNTGDFYRASGFWMPFYHHLMDLFGMEKYMMNMYLHPELVRLSLTECARFIMKRMSDSTLQRGI